VGTADLVGSGLVGMAVGDLFKQFVGAGAAGQLATGNAQW
jgi:hypothetical protein